MSVCVSVPSRGDKERQLVGSGDMHTLDEQSNAIMCPWVGLLALEEGLGERREEGCLWPEARDWRPGHWWALFNSRIAFKINTKDFFL